MRELTDELLGTTWALDHEEERERQRLGTEAFWDRVDGRIREKYDTTVGGTMADIAATTRIRAHLDIFEERGVVDTKNLRHARTDIMYPEFGMIPHYIYSA